jgi:putative PIN family toxin of toxin-antitoxin system
VLRLVLDTNVWLDWLVFGNPDTAPIKAGVQAGQIEVFMAPACAQELERVLAYPLGKATLEAGAQADCLEECRRAVRWLDAASSTQSACLPVCRDRDDQKFLELARDCGADFLVTRDRALLVFARRKYQPLSFRIVTPQQLCRTVLPSRMAEPFNQEQA